MPQDLSFVALATRWSLGGLCPAAGAFYLMQTGDVGAALAFRHLDERDLSHQDSHLRRGGKIGGAAGSQVDAHLFASLSEQVVAQRHIVDGDLVVARRQIAHQKPGGLTAGNRSPVDDIVRLDSKSGDGRTVDHQTRSAWSD